MDPAVTEEALGYPPLSGAFAQRAPERGLSCLAYDGVAIDGGLFSIQAPHGRVASAEESYVRGLDRISTHPANETFPFQTQLLWSVTPVSAGVAVTLTVSLQTDLLDTQPDLMLNTAVAGVTPTRCGPHALRFDIPRVASLIASPHPSDAAECSVSLAGELGVLKLTPPFLEKGVIRRCRVAAIWLPAGADGAMAEAALNDFANLPLPLTA